MILPVYAYGHPVLRKISQDVTREEEGLFNFIEDLFETMHFSDGVGLAAPQVGRSIRVFIVDARIYANEEPLLKDFRKVFINPRVVEEDGEPVSLQEGCLSIPHIHEEVVRPSDVHIQYYDDQFEAHDEWFSGMAARIIQHEYDHLEGILFTDKLFPLRKRLLRGKLRDITRGDVKVNYKMVFPVKK